MAQSNAPSGGRTPSARLLVLAFSIVVIIVLGVLLLARRSSGRNAVQRYEAELRAKGERLTIAELSPTNSAACAQSFSQLMNAAGKLVMPTSFVEPRRPAEPGQARVLWKEPLLDQRIVRGTNVNLTWERVGALVQTNDAVLANIRAILQDPPAASGADPRVSGSLSTNFIALRSLAQRLAMVTLSDLHDQHLDRAMDDLEALAGMGRVNRDEFLLVSQMIRIAIANLGLAVTWETLQAPDLSDSQLERLQRAWENVDLIQAVESGFIGERAFSSELWGSRRGTRGLGRNMIGAGPSKGLDFAEVVGDYVVMPAYRITSYNEDHLFYLKTMQMILETIRAAEARRPWEIARQSQDRAMAQLNAKVNGFTRFRYPLTLMAIPNFSKAVVTAMRAETDKQMTLAAIAVRRYALRHGGLPPNLSVLADNLVRSEPWDCFGGAPLRYRVTPNGQFTLYSVGQDGRDDGGDTTLTNTSTQGIWSGKDALWPIAAGIGEMQPRMGTR